MCNQLPFFWETKSHFFAWNFIELDKKHPVSSQNLRSISILLWFWSSTKQSAFITASKIPGCDHYCSAATSEHHRRIWEIFHTTLLSWHQDPILLDSLLKTRDCYASRNSSLILPITVSSAVIKTLKGRGTRWEKYHGILCGGWVILSIVLITLLLGFGIRNAFSIFYPTILTVFGWERGNKALLFSITIIVYG